MKSPQEIQTRFDDSLRTLQPSLFHLADQLSTAYNEKRWNLLIGDDTSGRLVTRFARIALTNIGINIPTRYIAASKSVNTKKPYKTFDAYAKHITGDSDPRGLIITESTSRNPSSLLFTHNVLKPYCQTLDFAVLGLRQDAYERLETLGSAYYGHLEDKNFQTAVWRTFENPTHEIDVDSARSSPLTNLERSPDIDKAHAKIYSDPTYRDLSSYAYKKMSSLALKWANQD